MKHLVLFFFLSLVACTTPPKKDLLKKPLLFELTKDGKTHYILGTVHTPMDVEKMYPQLYARIKESTIFISEIDVKDFRAKTLEQIQEGQLYYENLQQGSLEKDLSPAAYNMTVDKLALSSEAASINFKPQRAYELLLEKDKKTEIQKIPEGLAKLSEMFPSLVVEKKGKLFDVQLEDYARSQNKKLLALESPTDPLLQKCSKLDGIAGIEKMAFEEKVNTTDQFYQVALAKRDSCYLKERNLAWMAKIKSVLRTEEKAFIAVGAGHLGLGDMTLLDLMKAEGYRINAL